MFFVFYGPEGSGKSTQAKKLADEFKLPYISTGDMIRYFSSFDRGEIGKACQDILNNGTYLSNELTCKVLAKRLKQTDLTKGLVLDGFPRNLNQAKFLTKLTERLHVDISGVFYLSINRQTAIRRVMARKRDNHDSLAKLESRLNQYYQHEQSTLNYYKNKNILHRIDGVKSIDVVGLAINKIVGQYNN